jgi:hypothetical protein
MSETNSEVGSETARFQAFAARRDDDLPPAWQMRANGRKIGILIGGVALAALIAVLFGTLLVG